MEFENGCVSGLPYSNQTASNGGADGQSCNSIIPSKRKRFYTTSENTDSDGLLGKKFSNMHRGPFVSFQPGRGIFHSESWKPYGTTLYQPVSSYLLVNVEKYDQISFEDGSFSIGDEFGRYLRTEQGHTMQCWRFDEKEKKLFVALSFLFTDSSIFQEVSSYLGS